MAEKFDLTVAGVGSANPAEALIKTMNFWENQAAGVKAGAVVVLREPGPDGWLRFTPQAEVADLLAKGFTVVELKNPPLDKNH